MICKSIDIWENELYQGNMNESVRPRLDTYILDGEKSRGAVLVCPGGGYRFVSDREAEPIALQLTAAGFHAFVLYYSVAPRKHPQPLLDLSRAMCLIRENATAWNVCPNKIAVCGFSAGGHLAASLAVHWDKPYIKNAPGITAGLNRPDACILCYPVITAGDFAHRGSFTNLLGEDADNDLKREMSLEHQINPTTPPSFIWHTFDDQSVPVENSLLYAESLRKNKIPFELHIFPEGPHGLSLATSETDSGNFGLHPHVAVWMNLCTEWLKNCFSKAD